MMVFSEIYGSYYRAMAGLIRASLSGGGNLSPGDMRRIIREHAFAESSPAIEAAIVSEDWQVVRKDGATAVEHEPSVPLSLLEKRWLKAVSLDPRMRLFGGDFSWLDGVEPRFTREDYLVFDKYSDGDPYENEDYAANFRLILSAINEGKPLDIGMRTQRGTVSRVTVLPEYLEYSEKDDKFRLMASGAQRPFVINLGRIESCRLHEGDVPLGRRRRAPAQKSVVLELRDERNALERVMLHFSHFEKQAEKTEDGNYRLTVRYGSEDETELVIRILSFGPVVHVTGPENFVELIRKRLIMQMDCGL